jgi:PAS domain S-box-containing protein
MIDSNPDASAITNNAEMLQLLINSVQDHALILLDAEGRIALWNAGAERLLGWTPSEALGQSEALFFTLEDSAAERHIGDKHRAHQEGRAEQERWHLRKDGTPFWANSLLIPLHDTTVRGYARILRDLSERQAQERRIEEAHTRLETALDVGDIGTWHYDIVQDRVYADHNLARFFSVSPEEANGGPLENFRRSIHPDDAERVTNAILDSVANGTRYDIEYRLIRSDGEYFWINSRGKAQRDAVGKPITLSGVAIDITAKHAAETSFAEARAQARRERLLLNAVLDALPTGVVIADEQGKILRFNRAFEQIWGGAIMLTEVAAYGEYVGYWHDSGELIKAEEWTMARALRGETCPGDVIEVQPFDGSERRVILTSAAPIRDTESRIVGGVVAMTDITEQVRVEESLRNHQTHIETLNARLLRSLRETHHRVKNNLQVIAALVEVQDEYALTPALQRIKHHAHALASIHDMLTQQVKEDAELTQVPVADVMARLVPSLEHVSGGRKITTDVENFLIDIQKAASLALLVNECVSNAIKHSSGSIDISLRIVEGRAYLTICDDGTGFPPDFDPRIAANTGLELIDSAARWDLRGDVRFENAPAGGGCVVCTFPIA